MEGNLDSDKLTSQQPGYSHYAKAKAYTGGGIWERKKHLILGFAGLLILLALVVAVIMVATRKSTEDLPTLQAQTSSNSSVLGLRLKELSARLDKLEQMTQQSTDGTGGNSAGSFVNSTLTYLVNANTAVTHKIKTLQTSVDELSQRASAVKMQLSSTMGRVKDASDTNTQLLAKMEDMQQQIQSKTSNAVSVGGASKSVIMFSAAASQTRSYTNGATVLFDHVFANIGNAFNADTGYFTCPKSGYYLFSVVLHEGYNSDHRYKGIGELTMGSTKIFRVFAYDDTRADTSSNLAIVKCTEGSTVRVKATETYKIYDSASHFNTFTGILMKEGIDE